MDGILPFNKHNLRYCHVHSPDSNCRIYYMITIDTSALAHFFASKDHINLCRLDVYSCYIYISNSEMYFLSLELYICQTAKCFKCTISFSNIPLCYNRAYIYTITSILHSLVICWLVPKVYAHQDAVPSHQCFL